MYNQRIKHKSIRFIHECYNDQCYSIKCEIQNSGVILGPVSGALTNRFGHRAVVIAGGLTAAAGLVSSIFAHNIYHLYVTFGIITGTCRMLGDQQSGYF